MIEIFRRGEDGKIRLVKSFDSLGKLFASLPYYRGEEHIRSFGYTVDEKTHHRYLFGEALNDIWYSPLF